MKESKSLSHSHRPGRTHQLRRALVLIWADEIDRQIHELAALRDTLRHVADCPSAVKTGGSG
jgi:hypothetical protein